MPMVLKLNVRQVQHPKCKLALPLFPPRKSGLILRNNYVTKISHDQECVFRNCNFFRVLWGSEICFFLTHLKCVFFFCLCVFFSRNICSDLIAFCVSAQCFSHGLVTTSSSSFSYPAPRDKFSSTYMPTAQQL